jgi:hypothetical protein
VDCQYSLWHVKKSCDAPHNDACSARYLLPCNTHTCRSAVQSNPLVSTIPELAADELAADPPPPPPLPPPPSAALLPPAADEPWSSRPARNAADVYRSLAATSKTEGCDDQTVSGGVSGSSCCRPQGLPGWHADWTCTGNAATAYTPARSELRLQRGQLILVQNRLQADRLPGADSVKQEGRSGHTPFRREVAVYLAAASLGAKAASSSDSSSTAARRELFVRLAMLHRRRATPLGREAQVAAGSRRQQVRMLHCDYCSVTTDCQACSDESMERKMHGQWCFKIGARWRRLTGWIRIFSSSEAAQKSTWQADEVFICYCDRWQAMPGCVCCADHVCMVTSRF